MTISRLLPLIALTASLPLCAAPPAVGEKAPAFELMTMKGKPFRSADSMSGGNVVLLVLRGYPGYQCPLCNRQVREFIKGAEDFAASNTRVIMVYPGPAARAEEFTADMSMPANFEMLLDPEYKMVNQYNLRWDAPKETAYPSTFVIDGKGVVRYQKVSTTHGGRSTVPEVMEQVKMLKNGI